MTSGGSVNQRLSFRLLVLLVVVVCFFWPNRQLMASQNLPEVVADLTPKGWQIFDEIKQFTPENLYEQINGRASFFLAYDMVKMTYASFVNSTNSEQFLDLSIYDMGTTTSAFGVFSSERSPGEPTISIGRLGYCSGASFFIWKGQYYIRIISSETTGVAQRLGMDLARSVTNVLPDSGEQPWGVTALPLRGRISSSIQYVKVDAMGLDFLNDTYLAEYKKGDAKVMVFLSRRDSDESAQTIVKKYSTYAIKYGKVVNRHKIEEVELVSCDMGENYDVIFHKGHLIGGVVSVKNQDLAFRAAIEFWEQLFLE
jgi:nitrogen regulatory protein PII-like uncharacterized protein